MEGYLCIITLCVLAALPTESGNICSVDDVDIPKWYQPEYEDVTVNILMFNTTTTVANGQETSSPEQQLTDFTITFGRRQTPEEADPQTTIVTDSSGEEHQVKSYFNGTHVCVAYNYAKGRDAGGTEQWCEHTCVAAFDTSTQKLLIYEGSGANPTVSDYLIVKTKYANNQRTVLCYTREEPYSDNQNPTFKFPGSQNLCPLGEKCTVTVAKKDASSPVEYYARCQPNDTDICASQGCKNDTLAPYVGEGMYSSVCDWCCGFNLCNNIKNCTQNVCHFYGEPIKEDVDDDDDDDGDGDKGGTSGASPFSLDVWIWFMMILAILGFVQQY